MTGRLQQAEEANTSLLAQMARTHSSDSACAAVTASKQTAQSLPQSCLRTAAVNDLVHSSDDEEQASSRHGPDEEEQVSSKQRPDAEEQNPGSQGRVSASQSDAGSTEQPSASHLQQEAVSDAVTGRQSSGSSPRITSMQRTLEGLAATLSQDVLRLQKAMELQSSSDNQSGRKQNWGFPISSPGPSRPVTAAPCGSSHRPKRQWSANSAKHKVQHSADVPNFSGSPGRNPARADSEQRYQHADLSLYNAAGQVAVRRSRRHMEQSWRDPVPPSRMPEEILRQAREDYMQEKNRVRDKRLQELAMKADSTGEAAG